MIRFANRLMTYLVLLALAVGGGCGGKDPAKGRKLRISSDDLDVAPAATAAAPTPAAAASPAGTPPAGVAPVGSPIAGPTTTGAPTSNAALPTTGGASGPPPSERQARELTIARMQKIHKALEAYRKQSGGYPIIATVDPNTGRPAVSWRVLLLPSLGYKDLYLRFVLREPWNSPHNLRLLAEIPPEYQSPERRDTKTNILMVAGPGSAGACPDGASPDSCPDGLAGTMVLVEASDALARPWTQPGDYEFVPERTRDDLFRLRRDGCFVLLGEQTGLRLLPADVSSDDLKAMITAAGNDAVDVQTATRVASAEVDAALVARLEAGPVTPSPAKTPAAGPTEGAAPAAGATASAAPSTTRPSPAPFAAPVDERLSVPSAEELAEAAALLKKIVGDSYDPRQRPEQRRAFAQKMLQEQKKLGFDLAGQFVVLRAARDVAAQAGDVTTAMQAAEQLSRTFRVGLPEQAVAVLERSRPHLLDARDAAAFCEHALAQATAAVRRDDFASSKQLLELALPVARRIAQSPSTGRDLPGRIHWASEELTELKRAHDQISGDALALLQAPDDPRVCESVGRYLCLIKRDWQKGLPLLVRCQNDALRDLARADLELDSSATRQADMADRWWAYSELLSAPRERLSVQIRAAQLYKKALPSLPGGLARVLAEKRAAEIGGLPGDYLADVVPTPNPETEP